MVLETIQSFMNLDFNQQFKCITFYGHQSYKDEDGCEKVVVSKFGAVYTDKKGNVKQIFESEAPFELDKTNNILKIGTEYQYVKLVFSYSNLFYI